MHHVLAKQVETRPKINRYKMAYSELVFFICSKYYRSLF